MAEKIYIDLDRPGRILSFRHKDLRDAGIESGKGIGQLIGDPFSGWPYLLKYGLRQQDKSITLDQCSSMIEMWCRRGDTLEKLGKEIWRAVEATGLIPKEESVEEGGESEGNAPSPTASTTT